MSNLNVQNKSFFPMKCLEVIDCHCTVWGYSSYSRLLNIPKCQKNDTLKRYVSFREKTSLRVYLASKGLCINRPQKAGFLRKRPLNCHNCFFFVFFVHLFIYLFFWCVCFFVLCPHLQRSWRGIWLLLCLFVHFSFFHFCLFIHEFVIKIDISHKLFTMHARFSELYVWITYEQIND